MQIPRPSESQSISKGPVVQARDATIDKDAAVSLALFRETRYTILLKEPFTDFDRCLE